MKSAPSPAACPDRALPRSAWLRAAPAGGGGARGLALPAAKSPTDDATIMFTEHAKNAIVVARTLHEGFSQVWNLSPQDVYATPMAPNNVLYTSYLLRVAYERPFHEGLGAFLPSYWIYWEVGKALEQHGAPVSLYQRWIDTYASTGFAAVVQQILALVN